MGLLDGWGNETYSVECERCGEKLVIEREEVENEQFVCPACGYQSDIPPGVQRSYRENRAEEERKRKEEERREEEKRKKERERREEKRRRAVRRKEKRRQQREKKKEREKTLKSGTCPECGGELEVTQEGYQTGKGAVCCLLAGPLGLLGGLLGSGDKTRVCKGCGKEYPFDSQDADTTLVAIVLVCILFFFLVLLGSC